VIYDLEAIKVRLLTHRYDSYHAKLVLLDNAINQTLGGYVSDPVHLALSGGVDSSLLLAILAGRLGRSVVAHTIGTSVNHPDVTHVRVLSHAFPRVEYRYHIIRPCECDAYIALYAALSGETKAIVSGDVIDELAGGYSAHQTAEDKQTELYEQIRWVRSRHLDPMQDASNQHGIAVFLPYAAEAVFTTMAAFRVDELVTGDYRKKPIYDLAVKYGIPQAILARRKIGLVSIEAANPPPPPQPPPAAAKPEGKE